MTIRDKILLDKVENCTADDLSEMIDKHIFGRHAERDRKILKRRLIDGVCYEPLADEAELSVRQTKNIVYKGINRLLAVL